MTLIRPGIPLTRPGLEQKSPLASFAYTWIYFAKENESDSWKRTIEMARCTETSTEVPGKNPVPRKASYASLG